MRLGLTGPAAAGLLLAACSTQTASQPSPSPTFASPSTSVSASPSPSPQPLQRMEPSLPLPIEETAAAAAGGKLYVMGGFNAAGASLSTVYVFDGTRWTSGPRLPLPLDHASAATLDGHVYIAGGHSNGADSARLFRLDGSRWTALASMHYARGGHALVAARGKLYAIGGNSVRGNIAAVEAYDLTTNTWKVVASLPQPRNHVMGFLRGDIPCVAGGRSPTTARVDCLDPGSLAWLHMANLPVATSGGGAATFENGDIVLTGGQDAAETQLVTELIFSSGRSWVRVATMLVPRHGFELAILNGRAWACGGGSAPGLHPVATCTSLGDRATSKP